MTPRLRSRARAWARRAPALWVWLLLAALALGIAARRSDAVTAAAWPRADYNPHPLADDVILPMPCGGAMVFRKVLIPSDGPLGDRLVRLGSPDGERGSIEGSRPASVAGSFSAGATGRYYLIGKYEVSRLQYEALGQTCPAPSPDGRLPQTGMSWLEAMVFADRYTLWLLQHAANTLPADDGEPGFVRLPTEVEWEFAARGGIAVSESDFQERVFPTPGGMDQYVWSAGPQSANGAAQRVGLLKPNPVGLHDMLGNVDEMVFDPFYLNKLDRLHGQAGGFIVRGGNFATAGNDIHTASRQEVPYYQGQQPRRSPTTGFRLAVSNRVVTSRNRLQAIERAWAELGTTRSAGGPGAKTTSLAGPALADPIAELGAIAGAAPDPDMQRRLKSLQTAFRASFEARDAERDRAAKARLRLGTFLCQKLKDDGLPIERLRRVLEACVAARGAQDARCRDEQATIEAEEATQWNNLRYYADTIVTLVGDYDEEVVSRQLGVLKSELAARSDLQALVPVANRYAGHVAQYRREQTIPRASWLAECKGL